MADKRPVVLVGGELQELSDTDALVVVTGQVVTDTKQIDLNNVGQIISEWFDISADTTSIQLSNTPSLVIDVIYNKSIHLREGSSYDWTISGDTITFTQTLSVNDTILVIYKV